MAKIKKIFRIVIWNMLYENMELYIIYNRFAIIIISGIKTKNLTLFLYYFFNENL